MIEPRVFKGARDFLPEQMLHRERILDVMRTVFKKYGFAPLETPAIEYLDVLTGKYGEDADRLIYHLDYKPGSKDEAALHYDLTVPFSRVIAMNPDITLPFKRYQIQPVWRADRPQPHQGRFREFYQCDVDCVGSTSMVIDAEMVAITYEVLSALGFNNFLIKINNRKILNGITQYAGLDGSYTQEICRSIDKLDKISFDEVEKELIEKKIPIDSIKKLMDVLVQFNPNLKFDNLIIHEGDIEDIKIGYFGFLDNMFRENGIEVGLQGINELAELFKCLRLWNIPSTHYKFDLSLARGLDYYTGPIFETKLPDHPHIGSLTGGGRYDNLIGMFTGKDSPSVGTTLGLDRIFTAMQQLKLLDDVKTSTKVLVANFGDTTLKESLQLVAELRAKGINTEFYPEAAKLKKQFGYCDKKKIPFMCVLGEEEQKNGTVVLKTMSTGEQITLGKEELFAELNR